MKKTNKANSEKASTPRAKSIQASVPSPAPEPIQISQAAAPEAPKPAARKPASSVVAFELVQPDARKVCVAGTFNEWRPESTPLERTASGRWIGNLPIPPGRHEYLFVVDGRWLPDPKATETVRNPFGGQNSVMSVAV